MVAGLTTMDRIHLFGLLYNLDRASEGTHSSIKEYQILFIIDSSLPYQLRNKILVFFSRRN